MMDGGAMMGPGGNMGPGNNMVRTLFNDCSFQIIFSLDPGFRAVYQFYSFLFSLIFTPCQKLKNYLVILSGQSC